MTGGRRARPAPLIGTDVDEAALIAAAAAGDHDAFAQLFRRHVDRVRGILTRLVGYVPERDDLVQKVFLALAGALPRYRGEGALSTYLHRVTVNVALEHLRSGKRQMGRADRLEDDADLEHALTRLPTPNPEDRVRARADLAHLLQLLDRLSPKKRVAFVLVAVEGCSLAEAAALIGANEETVKQRVLSARREILAWMADGHIGPALVRAPEDEHE